MLPSPAATHRSAPLVLLLAAYVLLALVYVVSVPPWEAPDEPAHYRRVRSLTCSLGLSSWNADSCKDEIVFGRVATWSLHPGEDPPACVAVPQATERRVGGRRVWNEDYLLLSYQQFQPRFGHLAWVPWFFLTGPRNPPIFVNAGYPDGGPGVFLHELDADPALAPSVRRLRVLRGFGLVFGLLTVLAAWKCGMILAPKQPGVALAAGSFVAFLPQFTFVSAYVNNDIVAAAASAWLTFGVVQRVVRGGPITSRWLAGVLALLLLAVSARPNAAGLAGFTILGLLMVVWRRRGWKLAVLTAAATSSLLLLGALVLRFFFEPFWITWSGHFRGRLLGGDALSPWEAVRGLSRSLIGVFGWMDVSLPPAAYAAAGVLVLLVGGAVVFQWLRPSPSLVRQRAVPLLVAGVLLIGVPAFLNALSVGQAQGRYLFPALVALAALGGLGTCGFLSPRAGLQAAGVLALALFAANLAAVFGGLRPAYAEADPGRLTRMETSSGPLLLQHGIRDASFDAIGLGADENRTWLITASEDRPVSTTLVMQLLAGNRQRLLEPALQASNSTNPTDLPGLSIAESTGPGRSVAARVKPRWMTSGGRRRRVLAAHPTTHLVLDAVAVPAGAQLEVRFGIDERAWDQSVDGVSFRVLAQVTGEPQQLLLERLVNPASEPQDRGWITETLDLNRWADRRVVLRLETLPGPTGDFSHDWAAWEGVDLIVLPAAEPFQLCSERDGRLLDPSRLRLELGPGERIQVRLATPETAPMGRYLVLSEYQAPPGSDL